MVDKMLILSVLRYAVNIYYIHFTHFISSLVVDDPGQEYPFVSEKWHFNNCHNCVMFHYWSLGIRVSQGRCPRSESIYNIDIRLSMVSLGTQSKSRAFK
jgi:hypothetical protein